MEGPSWWKDEGEGEAGMEMACRGIGEGERDQARFPWLLSVCVIIVVSVCLFCPLSLVIKYNA